MASLRILNENINILFVHIPKTGGTSVADWLMNQIGSSYYELYLIHPLNKNINLGHPYLQRIGGHKPKTMYDAHQESNPFRFSCVRNPWARVFSAYQHLTRYWQGDKGNQVNKVDKERLMHKMYDVKNSWPDFNEFVSMIPYMEGRIGYDWDLRTSQCDWIEPGVDLVLKTEHLARDFVPIQEMFNCYIPLNRVNLNPVSSTTYRDYYNDASKDIIADVFSDDVERFEYTF
jgi:hypothetical protein